MYATVSVFQSRDWTEASFFFTYFFCRRAVIQSNNEWKRIAIFYKTALWQHNFFLFCSNARSEIDANISIALHSHRYYSCSNISSVRRNFFFLLSRFPSVSSLITVKPKKNGENAKKKNRRNIFTKQKQLLCFISFLFECGWRSPKNNNAKTNWKWINFSHIRNEYQKTSCEKNVIPRNIFISIGNTLPVRQIFSIKWCNNKLLYSTFNECSRWRHSRNEISKCSTPDP